MGEHRWRGYSHEELYRQIHAGPGPNGSTTAIGRWQEMAKVLTEIDDDIKRLTKDGSNNRQVIASPISSAARPRIISGSAARQCADEARDERSPR